MADKIVSPYNIPDISSIGLGNTNRFPTLNSVYGQMPEFSNISDAINWENQIRTMNMVRGIGNTPTTMSNVSLSNPILSKYSNTIANSNGALSVNDYTAAQSALAKVSNSDNLYNAYVNNLNADTSAQEANRALGITGGVLGGLASMTNIGLGIWQAIESNKNLRKQRQVADKQIELANEQILASQQYRNERADEIKRLNRVRSNTNKAFNTGSVVTRSY